MIQAGQHLRLALEPGKPVRIVGKGVGEDSQRNLAVELGVGGLPDLPHPAFPEESRDVVAPYALESHLIRPETVPERYSFLGAPYALESHLIRPETVPERYSFLGVPEAGAWTE